MSKVAIIRTQSQTVMDDYAKVKELIDYKYSWSSSCLKNSHSEPDLNF